MSVEGLWSKLRLACIPSQLVRGMTRGMLFDRTVGGKSASTRKRCCRWGCTAVRKGRLQSLVWAITNVIFSLLDGKRRRRTWSARPFRSRSYRLKKEVEEMNGWNGSRSSNLMIRTEPVLRGQRLEDTGDVRGKHDLLSMAWEETKSKWLARTRSNGDVLLTSLKRRVNNDKKVDINGVQ